ncbi:MAG: FeoB-associated Cys-rich membrane protein [Oscillospiraceae bacterium]|nr:FeoB-associated Cys-rich membrane protein [Oscillospiraceae bacterium]
MLGFITENLTSIIVLLVVAVILFAIIFKMVKDKKQGKSSCGCGCKGCPNSGNCHGH